MIDPSIYPEREASTDAAIRQNCGEEFLEFKHAYPVFTHEHEI